MNTLIIDDEQPAIKVLVNFIKTIPYLNLKLGTTNAYEGLTLLNNNNIDLLFLDIEMPDITGVELLKSLDRKPMVVFTTAYEKYALQGFELDVLDYLVKPIRYQRFLKAADKAHQYFQLNKSATRPLNHDGQLLLKVEYKTVKVHYSDIQYIEGLKDYVKVHTTEGMLLTRLNLKGIQAKLPSHLFTRVHRSYIAANNKITSFQKGQLFIDDKPIPIGPTYLKNLSEKLTC